MLCLANRHYELAVALSSGFPCFDNKCLNHLDKARVNLLSYFLNAAWRCAALAGRTRFVHEGGCGAGAGARLLLTRL